MRDDNIYKAFHAKPYAVTNDQGEILDLPTELNNLTTDIKMLTSLVEWHLKSDITLLKDITELPKQDSSLPNAVLGRKMGITLPLDFLEWKSGRSRYIALYQERVVSEAKSWSQRYQVTNNINEKYVSQGWKRTARATRPENLTPKMNLGVVDKGYASIINDPITDGYIVLRVVISGVWRKLYFEMDLSRFSDAYKVSLPSITVTDNGDLRFTFSAVYEYVYADITSEYVVAVDVGIHHYATVVVIRVSDQSIVYSTTLSQRVHSLDNSIERSEVQKNALIRKGDEEYILHREAASHKKRELAILTAQEIADIAADWGNAVIVFEDLSWIVNTMQNGRWNRGELVRWVKHYAELNGSRVFKVSPYRTSQDCHKCGEQVTFPLKGRMVKCLSCGYVGDRDVNAAGNIGIRFIRKGILSKVVNTRRKSKKYTKCKVRRSPVKRESLKYPGVRRDKHGPTPKRGRSVKKVSVVRRSGEVRYNCGPVNNNDDCTVVTVLGIKHTAKKTGKRPEDSSHDPGWGGTLLG